MLIHSDFKAFLSLVFFVQVVPTTLPLGYPFFTKYPLSQILLVDFVQFLTLSPTDFLQQKTLQFLKRKSTLIKWSLKVRRPLLLPFHLSLSITYRGALTRVFKFRKTKAQRGFTQSYKANLWWSEDSGSLFYCFKNRYQKIASTHQVIEVNARETVTSLGKAGRN